MANVEVKGRIMQAYCKSLIIYVGGPLLASGVWSRKQIESIERESYRKIHRLPRDV